MGLFMLRNRPETLAYAFFKPRWRYGVKASRAMAVVQAPMHVALGGFMLFGAFHSAHARIFGVLAVVLVGFSACLFLVDAMSDER